MLPFWIFHLGCVASLLSRPCRSWAVFWAAGVHAPCVVLRARCPGPPGSCSPVCTPRVWCCVYGVPGLLAPVHRCAHPVCDVAWTVSSASWLQLTGVHTLCVVLRVRCPGPLGSCSPACTLSVCCCVRGALCRVYGVLGSGSPVCTLCVRCCMCGVLGLLAPVHRCACSLCAPRMLPLPLPHPCLFLCMLSLSVLLLLPGAAVSSSWCPSHSHSSLRLSPLFRPLLLLFPPGSCPPCPPSPPHLALAFPFRHRVPSALVRSGPGSRPGGPTSRRCLDLSASRAADRRAWPLIFGRPP